MVAALKIPPTNMTVTEFLSWDSGDYSGRTWQLRDGEPEMVAPATDVHGSIHSELGRLIGNHLLAVGRGCRAVSNPGVIPRVRSDKNMLAPDIGVTFTPVSSNHDIPDPVLLIEVLSPSNKAENRANILAYTTIPSVSEILIVSNFEVTTELLRRQPDGTWPERPEVIRPDEELHLASIDFIIPLRAPYRTSGLV
jgi:Uma2 family endonuclease